jgi:hypothetical protein
VLTRYELTRLLASPAFPAFDARVRRDLRRLGQQLHKARGPLVVGRVTVANLRSRVQSLGLAVEPRRTANVFATCRIAP